ncbi:hypothetical protein Tco_0614041 [Tanacetum coccineum]
MSIIPDLSFRAQSLLGLSIQNFDIKRGIVVSGGAVRCGAEGKMWGVSRSFWSVVMWKCVGNCGEWSVVVNLIVECFWVEWEVGWSLYWLGVSGGAVEVVGVVDHESFWCCGFFVLECDVVVRLFVPLGVELGLWVVEGIEVRNTIGSGSSSSVDVEFVVEWRCGDNHCKPKFLSTIQATFTLLFGWGRTTIGIVPDLQPVPRRPFKSSERRLRGNGGTPCLSSKY